MRRERRGVVQTALAIAVVVVAGVAEAGQNALPRVRALDGAARKLLSDARSRSNTVRDLEAALKPTDVVVYVRFGWRDTGEPEANLRWVSESAGLRYVVVKLSNELNPDRRIEMLAHELHHATEIADATWVHGEADLRTLYRRIGHSTDINETAFETEAARDVQRRARREAFGLGPSVAAVPSLQTLARPLVIPK